jgi:hypothetical protein
MLSLRSCQDEEPAGKPSSGISGFNRSCDPPIELAVLADDQKRESADSDQVNPTTDETLTQDIRSAESDGITNRLMKGVYADRDNFEGRIFKSTGEALFAICGNAHAD